MRRSMKPFGRGFFRRSPRVFTGFPTTPRSVVIKSIHLLIQGFLILVFLTLFYLMTFAIFVGDNQ